MADESFPPSVLIVDDEPVILQILAQAISASGVALQTAGSTEEAETQIFQKRYGCLLVDKNLPGKDGIELLRLMRKLQPQCACIVMTGYASLDSAVEALRLGAADYMTKPFPSLELVVEKVRLALEGGRLRFDNEKFLRRIREFEAELSKAARQIDEQRTEIEIFNDILEARVAAAEADLRRRVAMLSGQLASNIGGERAAKLSAQMVLDTAKQLEGREDAAALRGEIARIVRQVEDHLSLLR